jgi:hypothetical protein
VVALFNYAIATKYKEELVGLVMYLLQVAFALTVIILCVAGSNSWVVFLVTNCRINLQLVEDTAGIVSASTVVAVLLICTPLVGGVA